MRHLVEPLLHHAQLCSFRQQIRLGAQKDDRVPANQLSYPR